MRQGVRLLAPVREELADDLLLACAIVVVMTTTAGMLGLLLPLYVDANGHGLSVIGTLIALIPVSRLLARIPAGAAYGAARAKRQIVVALLALALAAGGSRWQAVSSGRSPFSP